MARRILEFAAIVLVVVVAALAGIAVGYQLRGGVTTVRVIEAPPPEEPEPGTGIGGIGGTELRGWK